MARAGMLFDISVVPSVEEDVNERGPVWCVVSETAQACSVAYFSTASASKYFVL